MESNKILIEDLETGNLDDLIYVCSSKKLNDPVHRQGIALKKTWLEEVMSHFGPVAKIAYFQGKPVAQITFLPEEADPTKPNAREGVIQIKCIYNSAQQARSLGIATKLLERLIEECRKGRVCNIPAPCRFLVTEPFNTGEGQSLSQFFAKKGFKESQNEPRIMYLSITAPYEPLGSARHYAPLCEDEGKAIIFYNPTCEFSFPFATGIVESLADVAPRLAIELINEWERPEESIRRNYDKVIVNSKPIKTFFMDKVEFRKEVEAALTNP